VKQANCCWQEPLNRNLFSGLVKQTLKYVPDWQTFLDTEMSEDCLYLNIYAQINSDSNKTVMVWIHGGGFRSGSISYPIYDGSILAANSDVIVVAINYRIGLFGFLSADQTELTGNYGLHDQVMALKWIKDNIDSFGGDPNNVVIFGQSAGAISVGYHLISSLSENLFSRAILQSGNAVVPIILAGKQSQTNATIDVIRGALCPLPPKLTDNSTQDLDNSSIACLRQVNASLLYDLYNEALNKRLEAFLPIEDNDFFAEHPYELVKKRKFNSNKQVLIGSNLVEG
jgi:carboxylesterase type B